MAVVFAQVSRQGWVFQERQISPRMLYLGNDQLIGNATGRRLVKLHPKAVQTGREPSQEIRLMPPSLYTK